MNSSSDAQHLDGAATQPIQRKRSKVPQPVPDIGGGSTETVVEGYDDEHPGGDVRHGGPKQFLRFLLFVVYFWTCCVSIVIQEFLGIPLYWINREWYYKNIAEAKEAFAITITCMTKWWSPSTIRISGDESVRGQFSQLPDGRLVCELPERLVLIANHQLYSDWIYLWWISYANTPLSSGHLYIILKDSLRFIPLIGQGMHLFNFIFMSRKWAIDKARMAYRLQKLRQPIPSGPAKGLLRPMWLLLFPEGTNLSDNGRINSAKWAAKVGIPDLQHQMIPRSTGTFFALNELKGSVEYVYDCTLAYEGIPRGRFGEEFLTLRSSYFEGRPPKSINMYWRRFRVDTIPLDDAKEFDQWIRDRWTEKDDLLEQYVSTGRFPSSDWIAEDSRVLTEGKAKTDAGFIVTEMKPKHWWEVFGVFVGLSRLALLLAMVLRGIGVAKHWLPGGVKETAVLERPVAKVPQEL